MEVSQEEFERFLARKKHFEELERKEQEKKAKEREYSRLYYHLHKEEISAKRKEYRKNNLEMIRKREREYKKRYREKHRKYLRDRYRDAHGIPRDAQLTQGRGNRKLTDEQAKEVRKNTHIPANVYAKRFGCSRHTINAIRRCEIYKDVE